MTESILDHVVQGNELRKAGRLDEAAKEYRTALRINPRAASAACGLGKVLHTQLGLKTAIECYTRAIEEDPSNVEALRNRARAIVTLGDYWKRREDLMVLRDIMQGYGGVSHLSAQTIGRAVQDLDRAIRIDPQKADLYVDRAIVYLISDGPVLLRPSEDIDLGLADLDRATKLDPNQGDAHLLRALIQSLHLNAAAKISFEKAIEGRVSIEPKSITVRRARIAQRFLGPVDSLIRILTRLSVRMLIAMLMITMFTMIMRTAGNPTLIAKYLFLAVVIVVIVIMAEFIGSILSISIRKTSGYWNFGEFKIFGSTFFLWSLVDVIVDRNFYFRVWSIGSCTIAVVLLYMIIFWWPDNLLTRDGLRRILSKPYIE